MPKGRHLKPEFFTDRHIVAMSPLARLLYQGLWCYAADCGHLDDEPVEIKMRILPADNCDIEELLDELVRAGRITRSDGRIHLPKLSDHARVDKRYETACERCAEPVVESPDRKGWGLHKRWHLDRNIIKEGCEFCEDEHGVTTTGEAPSSMTTRSDPVVTTTGPRSDHVVDGDGDGDGDNYRLSPASSGTGSADAEREFDEWWSEYPRKVGKGQARKAYRTARKKVGPDVLRARLRQQVPTLTAKGAQFCPHASTWLNGERWDDMPGVVQQLRPDGCRIDENGVRYLPDGTVDESSLPPVEDSWMKRRPGR